SVVRGCPPGLAGGISGSRILHSLSVTSTSIASSLHLSTSSLPFSFVTLPLLYHLAGVLAEPLSKPIYRLVLSHLASQAFAHSLLEAVCKGFRSCFVPHA